ncbi:MAG: galactose-1-phosphate uridylyltransferase [Spirochaetes bacterium GWF1_49_6]|nr:MAG: galactose-1-phosphate uridylyltransferase [Spirochaetes bacterium GWF1_49_6]
MPQLRQNIILKEWVVIATERAKRPEQLREEKIPDCDSLPEHDDKCPFCDNPRSHKEQEFLRVPETGPWRVRVVANRYPALEPPTDSIHVYTEGFFRWMDGIGHHEVIIESPKHNETIANMDIGDVELIIETYRKRYLALKKNDYLETIIPFRNHGVHAGASIPHPHSQIIAVPVIPRDVMTRMNESIRYHEEHRGCVFCKVLNNELEVGERIVLETPDFVSFIPYAAASPFHTWVFPKRHSSDFGDITDEDITDLAYVLRGTLRKIHIGLNDPDYNFIIRSAPRGYSNSEFFHWYITIVPRLTRTAGFELGTGMFINPSIPENDAEYLRSIKI